MLFFFWKKCYNIFIIIIKIMETLYTWLDRSPKYQYSEDLFFILIESKEKKFSYDFAIYKKVFGKIMV